MTQLPRSNKPPVNPAKLVFNKVARPGSAVGSQNSVGADIQTEEQNERQNLENRYSEQ